MLFHGWAWKTDGSSKEVPCEWDFPTVSEAEYSLPEVKLGRWGGFIFINPDENTEPLEDYLGDLSSQFPNDPYERRSKFAHVKKVLRCNWKVAQEAFSEAYHVIATHPTILDSIGDANTQYDVFGNYSRAMSPNFTSSPHVSREWEPLEDARLFTKLRHALTGHVYESMDDGLVHITNAKGEVSKFHADGDNPDECIMECLYMKPTPDGQARQPAPPIHELGPDDDWVEAPELGMLAKVFSQDVVNMPEVQKGLKAMKNPEIIFANYGETKPRHFHMLLEK